MFKGVLRDYTNKRNILIKIIDFNGNTVSFIPNDIPQLIADLRAAIDFDNPDVTCVAFGADPEHLLQVVLKNPVD